MILKVTQGHRYWPHSIDHVELPINVPQYSGVCLVGYMYSPTVLETLPLLLKVKAA